MWDMQQAVEVLALGVIGVECSLIPLRGVMWMGLYFAPLSLWMGLILCSWVLDSHYAGRRVTGGRRWQGRSSPIAKNTGVECECISTVPWPVERTTRRNKTVRSACAFSELYCLRYYLTVSMHHTHASLFTTVGEHSCSSECQEAGKWPSWLGGGRQELVMELSTRFLRSSTVIITSKSSVSFWCTVNEWFYFCIWLFTWPIPHGIIQTH